MIHARVAIIIRAVLMVSPFSALLKNARFPRKPQRTSRKGFPERTESLQVHIYIVTTAGMAYKVDRGNQPSNAVFRNNMQ
jgi:preprotein translocase subunit YajC